LSRFGNTSGSINRSGPGRPYADPLLAATGLPGGWSAGDDCVVRVTTVGAGDAFGSGGRFQTCIALAADEATAPSLLLDCGATNLTALRQQQIDPNQIQAVLVSHLHGDHFGGLPFLVLDGQFHRRTHDLTVVGLPGTRTRLEQAMETLFPGSSGVQRRFGVHVVEHVDRCPVELSPTGLGPLRATAYEVRHASGAPAYALRVDGSHASVAYSGDTEWTDPRQGPSPRPATSRSGVRRPGLGRHRRPAGQHRPSHPGRRHQSPPNRSILGRHRSPTRPDPTRRTATLHPRLQAGLDNHPNPWSRNRTRTTHRELRDRPHPTRPHDLSPSSSACFDARSGPSAAFVNHPALVGRGAAMDSVGQPRSGASRRRAQPLRYRQRRRPLRTPGTARAT